eukprot:TRINITY_DN12084_c0_g2_i1.p1 TRINITY_DN12084_c0_g2~~TRINITY_DN12084_c0_g2_i1.p1  ORF type:complete len:790 (+),score=265.75 TRINITY_DN12084_c0_g2_i1:54-2423(+)
MKKQRSNKRKLDAAANKLAEWKEESDEGSSDDEVENQKEKIMKKSMIPSLPIARVLCKKGAAYAIIADMGSGVEGFLPISEMVETKDMKMVLAQKLATIKPSTAPAPGEPDKRPRIVKVAVKEEGQSAQQLVLTGKGEKVCAAMKESWDDLSAPCKSMLRTLYDRDRIGQLTAFAGLSTGTLLEGTVQHRTNDGLIVNLSNPWNFKHRNLVGVAVGLNAELPDNHDVIPPSPGISSTPGTPSSIATDYNAKKLRPECIRCRVLDYDPASGFVDIACNGLVANSIAATDKKLALAHYKSLKKKISKPIPVQVILRKKDYAIIFSKPYAGVIGYLSLHDDPRAAKIKTGDRLTAIVEYVRIKPQAKPVRGKAQRWELKGRTMQDDDAPAPKKKEEAPNKVPQDPWVCHEPFMVLSLADAGVEVVERKEATSEKTTEKKTEAEDKVVEKVEEKATPAPAPKKITGIEVGFSFREPEGAEEENVENKKKKRKKKDEENELLIDEVERSRLNDETPKTKEDFERLVMGSPHSSYVWCQYMAYHVAQREYEQARLVAERALKTINYRESDELFNVWVAYLNLENGYGTPESLHAVFMRFVQHSDDPLKSYNALVEIGKAANHHVLVDKTYQSILKKFGHNSIKPWVDYASYLLGRGQQDDINKLQKRLLNNPSITQKQQVDFLLKVGCLQYRQGSIDKGRTIFEGLLVKYPKRTDLWSVYLDMEQVVLPKLDDLTRIRNVFDRVTSMPLSSKKMQYFMTRYMTFEKERGSPDRVEYVKQRAIDFVNARMGEADEE